MDALAQIVYRLATAMLAPVLAMLLILLAWSLFSLGAFLGEWRTRRLGSAAWGRWLAESDRSAAPRRKAFGGLRDEYAAAVLAGTSPERALADLEVSAAGCLAWMSFGVRTGPLLGLMGTLIPMGPALVGLSEGDIETMAGSLVIVFSTTVVGVFIGGVCYAMLLARRQWCARDLVDAEFAAGRGGSASDDSAAHRERGGASGA